jgi:uncharacterized Tic20 family protein
MVTIEHEPENASLTREERDWGMFCHLAAFAAFVIPFIGNVIGPLVIWLMRKEQYPFVDYNGKEVLNFHLTVLVALLASSVLMLALIGFLLFPAVIIVAIVLTIIGLIKAAHGEYYRYPLSIKFIK